MKDGRWKKYWTILKASVIFKWSASKKRHTWYKRNFPYNIIQLRGFGIKISLNECKPKFSMKIASTWTLTSYQFSINRNQVALHTFNLWLREFRCFYSRTSSIWFVNLIWNIFWRFLIIIIIIISYYEKYSFWITAW